MRTGEITGGWKRGGVLRHLVAALLVVLLTSSGGSALDHGELAKVLKSMPPNGPFWKYGNVVMRGSAQKAGMAPVVFVHWSHRTYYTCRVCHMELGFSMRAGGTGITRNHCLAGNFCGACHNGRVTFSMYEGPQPQCKRCHMEETKQLQKEFAEFVKDLPFAPFGNGIDWSATLRQGIINPINAIGSTPSIKLAAKLKQPLKLGTASPRSDVDFSHQDHFDELDCSNCHPDIFNIKKKSTEDFTMDSNIYGNFCGVCHMRVAFPMNDCKRCHQSMSNRQY